MKEIMSKSESEIKKLESAELAVKSIRNHQIGFTEQKIDVRITIIFCISMLYYIFIYRFMNDRKNYYNMYQCIKYHQIKLYQCNVCTYLAKDIGNACSEGRPPASQISWDKEQGREKW